MNHWPPGSVAAEFQGGFLVVFAATILSLPKKGGFPEESSMHAGFRFQRVVLGFGFWAIALG
jgi:hypothetical protein